ncbi:MAG: hypothetical protein AAFU77_09695 [Myxococcota bacterium]
METNHEQVRKALGGDRVALECLTDSLAPVIHARVARVLVRFGAAASARDIRQDVEDYTQEVYVALFRNGGEILLGWSPERGASLQNYVGLIAQRYVTGRLRSSKHRTWNEVAVDELPVIPSESPEARVESRELLVAVVARLGEQLTPQALQMFWSLIVEQRSVSDLSASTGLSTDALYMWRSRLLRKARQIAEEISLEKPSSHRKADQR